MVHQEEVAAVICLLEQLFIDQHLLEEYQVNMVGERYILLLIIKECQRWFPARLVTMS